MQFIKSAVAILEIFKISQQEAPDFHLSLGRVNDVVFCAPTFPCRFCSAISFTTLFSHLLANPFHIDFTARTSCLYLNSSLM